MRSAQGNRTAFFIHRIHLASASRKMVGRSGFEPLKAMPADLQSAPFGHFGTYPLFHPSLMVRVLKNAISSLNRPSESVGSVFHDAKTLLFSNDFADLDFMKGSRGVVSDPCMRNISRRFPPSCR